MSSRNRETKGVAAILVLEMIGRPPEHMVKTLQKLIKEMDEEKGVRVIEKKIKEPIEIEDQKGFYSTFAEVEVEAEEIMHIAMLMFKYMPSNVEIIEPELIVLQNNSWNDILNELTRRLHGYDEIARVMQMKNAQLTKKMREAGINPEEDTPKKEEEKTKRRD